MECSTWSKFSKTFFYKVDNHHWVWTCLPPSLSFSHTHAQTHTLTHSSSVAPSMHLKDLKQLYCSYWNGIRAAHLTYVDYKQAIANSRLPHSHTHTYTHSHTHWHILRELERECERGTHKKKEFNWKATWAPSVRNLSLTSHARFLPKTTFLVSLSLSLSLPLSTSLSLPLSVAEWSLE